MPTTTPDSKRTPAPEPSGTAWQSIPALAVRLLITHWPALLFWFFVQRVLYDLWMDAATAVAGRSLLLAYVALAVLVATQLATVIAMFLCLRLSLPVLSRRDVPQEPSPRYRWLRAVAVALLPFFAYYTTWGLLDGLRRQFQLEYIFSVAAQGKTSPQDVLHLHGLWLALLVTAAIRHYSKRRAEGQGEAGAFWPMLATVCEAYWVFVGARAITQLVGFAKDWWRQRVVYAAMLRWWDDPRALFHLLVLLKKLLLPAWDVLTTTFGGIVLPLVWLAMAAIIYGMDLKRAQPIDAADERLGQLGSRFTALPLLVRTLAGKASDGWVNKGVPVANSLRLVLRAGLPALVVLCVCYQSLELLDSWAWRAAVRLLGPHDGSWWNGVGQPLSALVGGPLSTRPSMLTEPLRVVLLAATFDCAIARLEPASHEASAQATAEPAATYG